MKMISKQKGFTIIELVVVFPIVAIVIGTLLVVLINLVVDNTTSKIKSELTYNAQAALDIIERDITYATDFLSAKDAVLSDPYVSDSPGGAWKYTGSSSDIRTLILRSYETTQATGASNQLLVREQMQECALATTPPITYNTIFFVKNNNLYKRTLTDSSISFRCGSAYQQQSCPADLASPNSACKVDDTLLARNVTKFSIDYFATPEDSTPIDAYSYTSTSLDGALDSAVSVKITLEISDSVAGNSISVNRSLRIAKLNSSAFTSSQNRTTECPDGFIVVPGNPLFGTSDFCAAKYETKILGNSNGAQTYSSSFVPESRASGTPWVNISHNDAKIEAQTACSGCHLITEAEWLTIAHNVLSVNSNWSGGSVGSGYIYSGHNDNSPSGSLAASSNDSDGYSGTGNSGTSDQRRTLTLTNGEVIWDLAGNVHDMVDGTIAGNVQPGLSGETVYNAKEWNNPALSMNGLSASANPAYGTPAAGNWSSTQRIGMLYSNSAQTTTRVFIRGGSWGSTTISGVFYLNINNTPTITGASTGFRMAR